MDQLTGIRKERKMIDFYGANWCLDTQRAKVFLKENNVDFNFINIDIDKDATVHVEEINNGKRIIPTLIINGKSYTNPDNSILEDVFKM